MEKYSLNKDIKVFCVTAKSFPEGIMAAYEKLQSMLPLRDGRNYFGISFPDKDGNIIYKAAVEEAYIGEASKLNLETFIIKKGEYKSNVIRNYMDNVQEIGKTFQTMISDPNIDPSGACVEMYIGEKDVRCMVRLK